MGKEDKKEEENVVDPLEMSDEDFLKQPPPPEPDDEESDTSVDDDSDTDETDDDDATGDNDDDESSDTEDSDDDDSATGDDDESDENKDDESLAADDDDIVDPDKDKDDSDKDDDKSEKKDDDKDEDSTEDKDDKKSEDEVDVEASYKKIMAPFKANGKQLQAKNPDDAIKLMQMGANYHQKMVGLKPVLKIAKMLEKADLMDPEKINFLIDLNAKNPNAIAKLIKDSEIDPLTIDTEKDHNYKNNPTEVSDTEIELDEVLRGIEGSQHYQRTLTVVSEDWDDASRDEIADNPNIIAVINGHIESGIFDIVNKEVMYERSLGRLKGLSDFDAYKQTGDRLQEEGVLVEPETAVGDKDEATDEPNQETSEKKKPESKSEQKRQERRKKASSTKTTTTPSKKKKFNPLDVSDEDFAKMDEKDFI